MSEQLCGSNGFLFVCVQHAFDQNKHSYASVEVIFDQPTKVTMKWHASLDPWALLLFGRLGLGDKNQLLKKES